MRRRPSDRTGAAPDAARGCAAVALIIGITALAGCEHPAPTFPAPLPVLERPVVALGARRAPEAHVLAPAAALVTHGGIPGVFVLQQAAPFPPVAHGAGGDALPEARFRMVKPGKTVQGRIEILSGLAGDETLVGGDLSEVRDGSPIAVKR